MTATGERLENLPPQERMGDANFDTDSYVNRLQYQIEADRRKNATKTIEEDFLKDADKVEVQPMKFDGKQIKVNTSANVVRTPKTHNKNLVPIIIVVILALALIGTAVYLFFFSGLFKKQVTISFDKPSSWSDTVYAFYYKDTEELKTLSDDTLKDTKKLEDFKMTANGDTTYTIRIDGKYADGYVIFFDDKNNAYPEDAILKIAMGQLGGEKIVSGTMYSKPITTSQASQPSVSSEVSEVTAAD